MKLENLDRAVDLSVDLEEINDLIKSIENVKSISLKVEGYNVEDIEFSQIPNNDKILNQIKAYALKEFRAKKESIEKEIESLD